jgi:ABC-type transport system involved in multi-copper enzyme maturation permease subunit
MPNLLWKEWHEQSWKLGFGCIVLGAMALIGLRARIVPDDMMMMWVCFLALTILPILSSTGLVPAERNDGTLEALLALPVNPSKILFAKTAMGFVLCVGPLATAMLASLLVAGGRELTASSIILFYAASSVPTLSLFIWMLALTIRLPSEVRAGLLGIGILIFWILATGGLSYQSVPHLAMAISPFALVWGVTDGFAKSPPLLAALGAQAVIASLLWIWSARQFANAEGGV